MGNFGREVNSKYTEILKLERGVQMLKWGVWISLSVLVWCACFHFTWCSFATSNTLFALILTICILLSKLICFNLKLIFNTSSPITWPTMLLSIAHAHKDWHVYVFVFRSMCSADCRLTHNVPINCLSFIYIFPECQQDVEICQYMISSFSASYFVAFSFSLDRRMVWDRHDFSPSPLDHSPPKMVDGLMSTMSISKNCFFLQV